jgi:hypothetical protein
MLCWRASTLWANSGQHQCRPLLWRWRYCALELLRCSKR